MRDNAHCGVFIVQPGRIRYLGHVSGDVLNEFDKSHPSSTLIRGHLQVGFPTTILYGLVAFAEFAFIESLNPFSTLLRTDTP